MEASSDASGDWVVDSTIPADAVPCTQPNPTSDCRDGWCRVLAGCFNMGSPEAEWGRGLNTENIIAVTLTYPFIIQQFELTQAQWASLGMPNRAGVEDGGTAADCLGATCPASRMTWFEAVQFTNMLSEKDGRSRCYDLVNCRGEGPDNVLICDSVTSTSTSPYECDGYRLPTEAEWEYAVRAGTSSAYYSGDNKSFGIQGDCNYDPNLDKIGWYCWNSVVDGSAVLPTHAVGRKQPNSLGLYDMSGNAYEFTGDPFHGRYTRSSINPWQPLTLSETDVTSRGGASYLWASMARSADRFPYGREWHDYGQGFRIVRTIKTAEVWQTPPLPIVVPTDGGFDAGAE